MPDDVSVMVALEDMPAVAPSTLDAVRCALLAGASIVQPCHRGSFGHPVGFASCWLAELRKLKGDEGARRMVRAHAEDVMSLPVDDWGCVQDVDTMHDLIRLEAAAGLPPLQPRQ